MSFFQTLFINLRLMVVSIQVRLNMKSKKCIFVRNIVGVVLLATLVSCERESDICPSETGGIVLNIRLTDSVIDVDNVSQYVIKIIPEYYGEIIVDKIGNLNWPISLDCGCYRIELSSSVIYVENNIEYHYYGMSDLFKVEPYESIIVPIELNLSAFHVESTKHQ